MLLHVFYSSPSLKAARCISENVTTVGGTLVLQFYVGLLIPVSIALCPKKKSIIFRRVRKICEKRLLTSSCLFFCLTVYSNSQLSGRIFIQLDIGVCFFFDNQSIKFKFHWNMTRITGSTVHKDQYTLFIISRSVLIRTRNVSNL